MPDPLAGTGATQVAAATPPPAAAPKAAAPAAPASPGVSTPAKADGSIIAADATPAITEADARAALTKGGMKAEDLAKLSAEDAIKQAGEAKAAGEAPAIEFKVPEGIEMSEELQGKFKGIIGDPKLSPSERAQALLDLHASALTAAAKAPHDLWAKTQGEWQAAVKADPELGGKNFDTVRSTIAKGITAVLGKDANAMFNAFMFTGAGNNPDIVRGMYRMSKALTEGTPVSGDALSSGKSADFASRVAGMYPSANQKAA